ncbi:MAG TPA: SpoIID/LytB domain-containing protein [Terriglobia bacterium]|nr:SpoIID/LytB domain-containing protein [Terriglobia bacterium]
MRKRLVVALLLTAGALYERPVRSQTVPIVRIGLTQTAPTVTLRASTAFTIQQNRTRTAKFTPVLALDPAATAAVTSANLQYRTLIELDGGRLIALPKGAKVQIDAGVPIEFDNRSYRGKIEVFVNSRNTLTVVNELPLEEYLFGVVPNELNPVTFGEIEALKAQAVAARTYIVRNLGQYKNEGYDICASDTCQVYQGQGTENPLSTQAVTDTRGMIAAYNDLPINALYSSTCGGRTEDAENIFEDKVPYLVSTICEYKHPEPTAFTTSRAFPDWKDAVLAVAGVSNFTQARRFMGLPGQGEPQSMDTASLSPFIRQSFYPTVLTASDTSFLTEQGILPPSGNIPLKEVLFRLIDKKNAFEWQQGVLTSWDGKVMKITVNNQPKEFRLGPDAPIYQRVGDERLPMRQGSWIGGELLDFRAVLDTIQMLVYRINFANPAADRYSRVALWQVHKTRQELDTAFRPLNIGGVQNMRVIGRGPSERPLSTEIVGSNGRATVRALRLRTLLGLRDSLFSFDIERNAQGEVLGMTFYGRGWGHGVGMCQVGAYGMALDGATYDQILRKYYKGIELKKLY